MVHPCMNKISLVSRLDLIKMLEKEHTLIRGSFDKFVDNGDNFVFNKENIEICTSKYLI